MLETEESQLTAENNAGREVYDVSALLDYPGAWKEHDEARAKLLRCKIEEHIRADHKWLHVSEELYIRVPALQTGQFAWLPVLIESKLKGMAFFLCNAGKATNFTAWIEPPQVPTEVSNFQELSKLLELTTERVKVWMGTRAFSAIGLHPGTVASIYPRLGLLQQFQGHDICISTRFKPGYIFLD